MTLGRRVFADEARAQASLARLGRLADVDWLLEPLGGAPDPDRALLALERWIGADAEANGRLSALQENPALAYRLAFVMGASQPIADALAKNAELGLILGDPHELSRPVRADEVIHEGTLLVDRSNSFLHSLDRLRYLRLRNLLRIVANDLSGDWEPETVWEALSSLADGVVELASRAVWREVCAEPISVAVIALGKHGSCEVNYSSDLDLMFVAEDDADMALAEKYCERLVRALEGKMGRGELYRIDLRLRPMGKAGPICLSRSAALRYYASYCEPWELQAMIRSRPCAGNLELGADFSRELATTVYKGPRSDLFLDGVIDAKRRYEAEVRARGEAASNIKLGPGGIRDIESIVQLYQLSLGDRLQPLQGASVTTAIEVLAAAGELSPKAADTLRASYRLFRQVEHRIQLRHGRQTHILPAGAEERQVLAKLMGFSSWSGLDAELRRRRALVRDALEARMPCLATGSKDERRLVEALGLSPGTPGVESIERLIAFSDSPHALAAEVLEDSETAERVKLIVKRAPRVVGELSFHRELWDVAFGEQVEFDAADEIDPGSELRTAIDSTADWEGVLETSLRREAFVGALKDAFHGDVERTFAYVASVAEAALLASLDSLGGQDIDVIGLGRLGSREPLLGSDWDVMLLCPSVEAQGRAERVGQDWVRTARRASMASGYFPLDVRLRPEGGSGLVVRSLPGFFAYADTAMESWERLAFTRARSLRGLESTTDAIFKAWAGKEWAWEDEQEILRMRKRVQTERMRPWESNRDIKLGVGCTLDLEWLLAILKLRHPEAISAVPAPSHRTAALFADAGALSKTDADGLAQASLFFARLRNVLFLLDLESDTVLPENPEKLGRVGEWIGMESPNQLLSVLEAHRKHVSAVFDEVVHEA
jgi:glutamate-ammonia-ligase adenylyltransferase